MFSKELELSISQAYHTARSKRHEFLTVEHLLLALLDNDSAREVLLACGVDIQLLGHELDHTLDESVPVLSEGDQRDTQPTIGFQRVLQRALYHVQSAEKKEVLGANVLVAMFSEKDSRAVYLLGKQDLARLDVVNYLSHGIAKTDETGPQAGSEATQAAEGGAEEEKSPLASYATNLNERARADKIDPLIGRALEVERTIQILCRRRKNNPLYVGESGVGKTALAEGLALRIVREDVPESCTMPRSGRWTSARCWPAPSTAGISRSASRRCSLNSNRARNRCCSSTRFTRSLAPVPPPAASWTRRT